MGLRSGAATPSAADSEIKPCGFADWMWWAELFLLYCLLVDK